MLPSGGGAPGCSQAQDEGGVYASPDQAAGRSTEARPAERWRLNERDCDEQPQRKCSRISDDSELQERMHEEVGLCPSQRDVLHRIVSQLDVERSSVVITNAKQAGAFAACSSLSCACLHVLLWNNTSQAATT